MSSQRDRRIDWDAPVNFLGIVPPTEGHSIRQVFKQPWTYSGLSPVLEPGGTGWEGENERLFLWFESFVRRAHRLISQPEIVVFEIQGHVIEHQVDYRVVRAAGDARAEIKGVTAFAHADYLPAKLKAIQRSYAQVGFRYEIISSRWLRRGPLAVSVDEIWRAKRVRVTPDERSRVLQALYTEPLTVAAVQQVLGTGSPRRLLALHASRDLSIDLMSGPIGPETKVMLGPVDQGPYARTVP